MLCRLGLVALLAAATLPAQDPAVQLALKDLQSALSGIGPSAGPPPVDLTIRQGATPPDGFSWTARNGRVQLQASTPLGAAYGIERLAWLTRSLRKFPPPDTSESPAMRLRLLFVMRAVPDSAAGPPDDPASIEKVVVRFRESFREALQYGYNGIVFRGLEHYVPSDDPVYGPRCARYRRYLKAIVAEAHAHHIQVFPYAEEAIYLPQWLDKIGAKPSVKDPKFWEAMADKYRRLLKAVPELDGVTPCVGEIIPSYDFRALDIVHSKEDEPSPRLEERYRPMFAAIHKVVAGEFGKPVLPWTWATNDWELSAVPDMYRQTFDPLPTENLMPVIKLTKHDAWYYGTAYNPTFGATKHPTMTLAELYSQYQGFHTVVDFPSRWAAAALQYAIEHGLQGVMTGQPMSNLLQPGVLYVFSRVAWNPNADADAAAREWASATFGPAAAADVTRILLLGSDAARHTFYWQPVARDGWPPQPHIRVNQIVLKGNAFWDQGREHDGFLRSIYLKLKPYSEETYAEASRAYDITGQMQTLFARAHAQIAPSEAANKLGELIRHHRATAALTRDYTRLILSYFNYREKRSPETRTRLAQDLEAMRASAKAYRANHKFFELAGIDQTVILADRALANLDQAERTLREAPTPEQIRERIAAARIENQQLLSAHPEAERILRWKGSVDARNILRIQGDQIRMERLTGDGIHAVEAVFAKPIPKDAASRWAIKPLRPRGVVHIMETPTPANTYSLSLYVDDPEPSSAVLEFELYRVTAK